MVKEIKELIKIVGKGNLLETLFIFLGSFQHADLDRFMDHRNHIGLSTFIEKQEEPLDKYFNLQFSLQGLFLIYAQAYNVLIENAQLNTQEVIDKIYAAVGNKRTPANYSALEELREEVIDQAELTEDQKKLKLLNVLANPKGELVFKTVEDFESKVLIDVRGLLSEENILNNKYDREFALNKCIIDFYYSIHQDIKVNKDVTLLFSIGSNYEKLSPSSKTVKREVLGPDENLLILFLAKILKCIDLPNENGSTKYTLNYKRIGELNEILNAIADQNNQDFLTFKSIVPTLEHLLKEQNSNKFEERIINNTYYSAPQKENKCRPNFIVSKKNHKNTVCKLILGVFVLSVGLYVADYFLMEQKLFNPMKGVLPQDNFVNLVIAAVLTIVIVYALFQLLKSPQEPPLSTVNEMMNENLKPLMQNKPRTT